MADISNSLKVVNIALVFWDSFSLLAIFNLILFIFTLCSLLVPAISVVGSAGGILSTGAAPAAGALGGIGGGGGRDASGEDAPSHHRVLVEKSRRGSRLEDRRTRGLGGL